MAIIAPIQDGKVQETASQSSLSKAKKTSGDNMDKDSFLQLLVAQMKYQDPLEPTSNTEYISQYAQFSQVEQMQNMAGSMDLQRASALVGQEVYIKTTGSDGENKYIQGKVDYVVYENGKPYLSVNEELYSMDDLDTVADKDYMVAYDKAGQLVVDVNKLPSLNSFDLIDAEKVESLQTRLEEMTEYESSFVATEVKDRLKAYVEKLTALRNRNEEGTAENVEEVEEA